MITRWHLLTSALMLAFFCVDDIVHDRVISACISAFIAGGLTLAAMTPDLEDER